MFSEIKKKVQERFKKISASGTLFYVEVDRDKIWQVYLNAFDEKYRQENTCNCCKSFLRQFAGIVGIDENYKKITLWDFETSDPEYANSIKAVNEYINSLPIAGVFYNTFAKCGTNENFDQKRSTIWSHYHIELPSSAVASDFGTAQGDAQADKSVLQRSLNEITDDALSTVLELIGQGALYRGNDYKGILTEFEKLRIRYKKAKRDVKDNFCWVESRKVGGAVSRIRNTAIGTLLTDLSEGVELDRAVTKFESVMAPSNYKRPTALVTPRMIENAKKRLEELNLTGSLYRRMLSDKDLNVNNAIYVDRPVAKDLDVFAQMVQDVTINPKTYSKVDEVSIQDFIDNVLPRAKSVKVLVENSHFGNFVSLVGPRDPSDIPLMKWNNNFSWSYAGEVADSIKERVKAAGGKVDGILRVSLSWNNTDDLDLHLTDPKGFKIYYAHRRKLAGCGAILDVDANGIDGLREDPVENISWAKPPVYEGTYQVQVHNFARRDNKNGGWELEVEYDGDRYNFASDTNAATGKLFDVVSFDYSKKNGVTIRGGTSASITRYNSREKWGIKSGQFHKVKAITLSPNHWNGAVGPKHFFFFLENCKADEKIRGFYNEQLKDELSADRKVFEVLGSKVTVDPVDNELSGLGFSETKRDSIIVEVEGTFKRTLRVKF